MKRNLKLALCMTTLLSMISITALAQTNEVYSNYTWSIQNLNPSTNYYFSFINRDRIKNKRFQISGYYTH